MVCLQSCKMWWRQGQWRGTYATENQSIDNVRVVLSSLSPPIQQIILHPICQHFPMQLSLEAIFISVCIVKLSILISVVGFLCLLVIYVYSHLLYLTWLYYSIQVWKLLKSTLTSAWVICLGEGGNSDFCVTQNFYHLTQTMDSEVFPLLWDIVRTVCNV